MITLNNDNKTCLFEQIFLIKLNSLEGFVGDYLVVILQTEAVITMARHTLRDSDGLMAAHTNALVIMLAVENTVATTSKIDLPKPAIIPKSITVSQQSF